MPYIVGKKYTKADIYHVADVPQRQQKGNWNTGYTKWRRDWYVFCNVGIPGRTGHDYANRFVGDELHWYGKTRSHVEQDSISSMLKPAGSVFVFYRGNNKDPFTFAGRATARLRRQDTSPVELTFSFESSAAQRPEVLPEEVQEPAKYPEGATKTVAVNIYERNPQARLDCLEAHGTTCCVCSFDFLANYGDIGAGYIHVHHLKPLGEIRSEYEVDPVNDLRPVCPNCHAMIHRRIPAYSIQEIREIVLAMRSRQSPAAGRAADQAPTSA
jgi:5-methylcytosine-specific restriction protein A